jgi:hypothetical protein
MILKISAMAPGQYIAAAAVPVFGYELQKQ